MVDKSLKVHMELLGANQKLRVDLFSSRTHHYFWEKPPLRADMVMCRSRE